MPTQAGRLCYDSGKIPVAACLPGKFATPLGAAKVEQEHGREHATPQWWLAGKWCIASTLRRGPWFVQVLSLAGEEIPADGQRGGGPGGGHQGIVFLGVGEPVRPRAVRSLTAE